MRTISLVLEAIKKMESLQLKAYLCPAGVPTIGYGSTKGVTHQMVKDGFTITPFEAKKRFYEDIMEREQQLSRLVKVPVNDYQFSALMDLLYNIGSGNLKKSDVLKYVNLNQFDKASASFMKHVYAGGKKLSGLVKRRKFDIEVFNTLPTTVYANYDLSDLEPLPIEQLKSFNIEKLGDFTERKVPEKSGE